MPKPDRKPDPDFEPDYEEGAQAEYGEGGDPDYDEGAQLDYEADLSDPDAQQARQEWYARKQQ